MGTVPTAWNISRVDGSTTTTTTQSFMGGVSVEFPQLIWGISKAYIVGGLSHYVDTPNMS